MVFSFRTMWWAAPLACGILLGGALSAAAVEIQLKDGQKLSARVLRKDGNGVVVFLPRESVVSIDGAALPPPVVAGAMAPDFTATDVSGATQTMADNRGHVTLLQFWASWCPHCRHDLPMMKTFSDSYTDKGLRIVTVSVDRDLNTLKTFIEKEQIPFSVIYANDHPEIPARYETDGVPSYFLIAKDGAIKQMWAGSMTESDSGFPSAVADLLGVPAPNTTPAPPGPSAASAPAAN